MFSAPSPARGEGFKSPSLDALLRGDSAPPFLKGDTGGFVVTPILPYTARKTFFGRPQLKRYPFQIMIQKGSLEVEFYFLDFPCEHEIRRVKSYGRSCICADIESFISGEQ